MTAQAIEFTELPADAQTKALLSDITALRGRIEQLDREHPANRELPGRTEWHAARSYAGLYAQLAEATGNLVDLHYDERHYDLGDAANREYESYLTLWRSWRERADQARVIATLASVRCGRCEWPVTPPCEVIA
jgi:hypothetical protein